MIILQTKACKQQNEEERLQEAKAERVTGSRRGSPGPVNKRNESVRQQQHAATIESPCCLSNDRTRQKQSSQKK